MRGRRAHLTVASIAALLGYAGCSRDLELGKLLIGNGGASSGSSTIASTASTSTSQVASSASSTSTSTSSSSGVGSGTSTSASSSSASTGSGGTGGSGGGGPIALGCTGNGPGQPEVVAMGPSSSLITTSGNSIYWVDQGAGGANATSSYLYRFVISPACNALVESTKIGVRSVSGIASDPTHVYLALGDPGEVWQLPVAGGNPVTLATSPSAFGAITVDATTVYWAIPGDGKVIRVPLGGGSTTEVASGEGAITSIAATDNDVFWTVDSPGAGAVRTRPKSLATLATTLGSGPNPPTSLFARISTAYWLVRGAPNLNESVFLSAPPGGPVSTLAKALAAPETVFVDPTYAYWTDSHDGTVMYLPLPMGPPTMLATGQAKPTALLGEGQYMYWVDSGTKTLLRVLRK